MTANDQPTGNQPARGDRRQWLIGLVRGGLLMAITATAGVLAARRRDDRCPELRQACGQCGQLRLCRLPAAENERRLQATARS
jgi:hypothetical protein